MSRRDGAVQTAAAAGASFFRGLDALRLAIGAGLDGLGRGPRPSASRVLHEEAGLRLRCYEGGGEGPVLLIVPAPIKAHWIWDLTPDCSVVRAALARGCRLHLLEWTSAPADWGLDEHVAAVARAVAQVQAHAGGRPHLLGHSLGGTLAALCAARFPRDAASLGLVEAPLRFGRASARWAPWYGRCRRASHGPSPMCRAVC